MSELGLISTFSHELTDSQKQDTIKEADFFLILFYFPRNVSMRSTTRVEKVFSAFRFWTILIDQQITFFYDNIA